MISIVDYGMGNLGSVGNAFEAIGSKVEITQDPSALKNAAAIVLPGVGAFGDGMKNLEKLDMIDALSEEILGKKKPYLGICLGLQFLAKESYEHGVRKGLGWIDGVVKKIAPREKKFKVPLMGWSEVEIVRENPLFAGLDDDPVFYFVHSYCLEVKEDSADVVTSQCWHGANITASVQQQNIFAVQFHPEKSQRAGLKLLENFVNLL